MSIAKVRATERTRSCISTTAQCVYLNGFRNVYYYVSLRGDLSKYSCLCYIEGVCIVKFKMI